MFLNVLPRLLRMRMRPWTPTHDRVPGSGAGQPNPPGCRDELFLEPCRRRSSLGLIAKAEEYVMKTARSELMFSRLREREGLIKTALEKIHEGLDGGSASHLGASLATASPQLQQCVAACKHIAETTRQQNQFESENEEWFLVARVIDRLCFVAMALVFFLSTIGIFLMGHFNQPPSMPFPGDPRMYLPLLGNLTDPPRDEAGADVLE